MNAINPFYDATRRKAAHQTHHGTFVRLPRAPQNASPVPHLTSLYANAQAGPYGRRSYPGNCGGYLIRDLLRFFDASQVLDPMTGSGTCRDVCEELGLPSHSTDLHAGIDACDEGAFPSSAFDFCWLHPPYWRQKRYTSDPRDLSRAEDLPGFLARYEQLVRNCARGLAPGGRLAILMGDYTDRAAGFVPLVYHTKRIAFAAGLRQCCTDIIRFSHGASSAGKRYRSSFIPGLHDVCMVFDKPHSRSGVRQ